MIAQRTVLATPEDRPALEAAVRASTRIAVDTEFHAERRYLPRLYLVQIRTADGTTWLVDPLEGTLLVELADALRAVDWLVHGGGQDMRLLGAALGGLPARVWDTQIAAGLVGTVFPAPYAALVREHLGVAIDKGATLTDWSRRPLSPAQLRYAAEDVTLLDRLWERLWDRATASGRASLVEAACLAAMQAAADDEPPDEAWRQVQGAHTLTPRQAAVLQELAAWRETTARAEDQPARGLLADALLTEFARRQPITVASLSENRRLPKGVVKRHGDEIVSCVQRGLRRPEWGWPQPMPEGSASDRVTNFLGCLVQADADARSYAARLALPRQVRDLIASTASPSRADLATILGWRDALVGTLIWEGLNGGVGVAVDPRGATRVVALTGRHTESS